MGALRALTMTDARNIRRDSLLRFLLLYPWLLGVSFRFLVPFITGALAPGFDLTLYYPLIVGFFGVIITPPLAGYIIGFLLLDERDDGTLTALQVTPLSMNRYLTYRLAVPVVISVAAIFIVIPLMNLIPVRLQPMLPIALLAGLEGPIFALLLASLAGNKVQGFAVMKGLGMLFLAPFAAWFVSPPWQWLLGLFPTYWPVKAFWVMLDGGSYWPWLAIGLIVHLLWLAPLLRRFNRVA